MFMSLFANSFILQFEIMNKYSTNIVHVRWRCTKAWWDVECYEKVRLISSPREIRLISSPREIERERGSKIYLYRDRLTKTER